MDNFEMDYTPDLVTLIDDENVEHNFEILDSIETDKGIFYALSPVYQNAADSLQESGEYYIMELCEEDGEEIYVEVEDDVLADELAEVFEKRFEEMFEFEEESE
ncbi:MAG: DUF1292 domain-containing protein [Ruminococcus sp.]|nr:DUF1292 domain-containing protein [Ruminococcus sp.]